MNEHQTNSKSIFLLTPIFGIVTFLIIYLIAASLYPGGSQINKNSIGFSWANNYWCNLLYDKAINGQQNPAKPVAMAGMFILCVSLSFFWFLFPTHIQVSKKLKLAMQVFGPLSMVIAFLLFTNLNHDFIINLASVCGLIGVAGALVALYKIRCFGLFAFGIVNLLLVALNNFVYHTEGFIIYLPVVQKITFVSFLLWIGCINITLYHRHRKHPPAIH